MARAPFDQWLLTKAESFGAEEALVGDLLEEMARGCPKYWVWQQTIGLYGFAIVAHARHRARVTPFLITSALAVVLLSGMSIAPLITVLETWAAIYLVTGTLSLFGHLLSLRTFDSRTLVMRADSE